MNVPNLSSDSGGQPRTFLAKGMIAVVVLALGKLLLHFVFNNRYGYFRDEFDYVACGNHLFWGYVDQPPLVPFLVRLSRMVLGDSLRSIRVLPALASSVVVVLAAMIAREFGGRRYALLLSATAVLIAPIYLSGGSLLTTNSFEPLLWMGCVYFAILAIKRDPHYWLWFGVVAGLGLEEKYSIAVLGFGIGVGLLVTRQRGILLKKWFWLGGVVAFLIFLPNLVWNIHNHWPFFELMHNIRASGRDVRLSVFEFLTQQLLLLHPLTAPIWIAGLCTLLWSRRLKDYRALGWCYVIAFIAFVALKGKNYYLAPIYPVLFAAGAVLIETGVERLRQAWLKPAMIVVLLAGGAWFAPLVVPVFSIDHFISYMNYLPFKPPRSEHSHEHAVLPQHYGDQFGWEELAAMTAQAWARVAPEHRGDCAIFGQNYGQAGAIDFFGPRYGLPMAISGHQTYYLWGPRNYSGNCMIVLDDKKERLTELFEQVEYVGTSDNQYALERNISVYLCRGARFGSLRTLWPQIKKWR